MRKVGVATLSAGAFLASAQANELGSDSTGKDWLTTPAEQRSGWARRTPNISNKDASFADAVDGCLKVPCEMHESELTSLTAACVTKLLAPEAANE